MSRPPFDPSTYTTQLCEKKQRLIELLAPFGAPEPEVFESPREHYRLRAEFRLWREGEERHYAMFEAGDKHTPIFFDDFPVASARINALMPKNTATSAMAVWNIPNGEMLSMACTPAPAADAGVVRTRGDQLLAKASRSALRRSLCVSVMPCGAPS